MYYLSSNLPLLGKRAKRALPGKKSKNAQRQQPSARRKHVELQPEQREQPEYATQARMERQSRQAEVTEINPQLDPENEEQQKGRETQAGEQQRDNLRRALVGRPEHVVDLGFGAPGDGFRFQGGAEFDVDAAEVPAYRVADDRVAEK